MDEGAVKREKGETMKRAEGCRCPPASLVPAPSILAPSFPSFLLPRSSAGWTLIELVITMTVLSILTLGVVPLVKNSVKRQREQQLRETLRGARDAIKEFHRDTIGMQCLGTAGIPTGTTNPGTGADPRALMQPPVDPRSKVVINDCTIFGVDNPDHYPPTLETLVEGVNVQQRGGATIKTGEQATDTKVLAPTTKKKVYLRAIPVDPVTGKAEWDLRSNYDAAAATDWGGENVFDLRSKSTGAALNGEKYSDW